MAFDATVGGANANSYIDDATADTYFASRMNVAAWSALDQTAKRLALMSATQRLEQEKYVGQKVSTVQRLKWPRLRSYDDDGNEFAGSAMPRPVSEATCELALFLLNQNGTDPFQPTGLEGFKSLKVDTIELTMRDKLGTKLAQDLGVPEPDVTSQTDLPPQVYRLLRGLFITLKATTGSGTFSITRA